MKSVFRCGGQLTDGLINRLRFNVYDCVWSYVNEVNPEGVPFQRGSRITRALTSYRKVAK
jgi:hypothetical protein